MIDTHAHYNSLKMDNLNKQIDSINESKTITKIINVGLDIKTSIETINISNNNKKFYSSIGIHPLYEGNLSELETMYDKFNNEKIVAIGETGIDTSGEIKDQIDKFINSIIIANKLHLPVIIHSNTTKNSTVYANALCIEILKKYTPKYGFVFHCFQPDIEILKEIITLGGYISVGSMITKPNAKKSLEVVKEVPIGNLLIETDYPFLTNNEIISLMDTFNKICEIKQIEKMSAIDKIDTNAKKLFYKLK